MKTRPIAKAVELGPSRCLTKKSIADSLAAWLERDDVDERLSIVVSDVPDGVRFVVRRDKTLVGERTLEVSSLPCDDVRAAVGLGIASAIDETILTNLGVKTKKSGGAAAASSSAEGATPPSSAAWPPVPTVYYPPLVSTWTPPPTWPPPASPGAIAPTSLGGNPSVYERPFFPPPPPSARPGPRRIWSVGVEVGALVSVLPKPALGVGAFGELGPVSWLDLRLAVLASTSTTVDIADTLGKVRGASDVGLVAGRFDACLGTPLGPSARLRGCLGLGAGAAHSSGEKVAKPESALGAWVSPVARIDLHFALTELVGLRAAVDGFLPALKPDLRILDPKGTLVASRPFPTAGLGFSAGPSLSF